MDLSRVLLATDLDGTFFGAGGKLLERNIRAVETFKAAGGRFTAATGRIHRDMLRAIPEAGSLFNAPAILSNGACLYDFSRGEVLSERVIDTELARAVMQFVGDYARAHDHAVGVRVSSAEGFLADPECKNPFVLKDMAGAAKNGTAVFATPDEWHLEGLHLYKIVVRGEAEDVARVRPLVEATFGDALSYTASHPRFFEINTVGCDKGDGLRRLAEWYRGEHGYRPVTVSAGNYENDLPMLRAADIAACPGDADERIRPYCRYVLCPFEEGTIAELIERLAADEYT